MRQSESLTELIPALTAAQGMFGPIVKDKVAKVFSKRTQKEYSYKYAALSSIIDAISKPLRDNGLALIQGVRQESPGFITVESMLAHKSGQFISEAITMPVLDPEPRVIGSTITYCRRYGANAILCIAPDEDDDAKVAEDLAERASEKRNTAAQVAADEYDKLDADMKAWVEEIAGNVKLLLTRGDVSGAIAELEIKELDQDTKLALWSRLDSKERSAIKKQQAANREAA